MRERANKIGAQLELWSHPEAGTEMELKIPAATAYQHWRLCTRCIFSLSD
jgi:nitrate/nitrite-specific signal transduction histidine kinase